MVIYTPSQGGVIYRSRCAIGVYPIGAPKKRDANHAIRLVWLVSPRRDRGDLYGV